MAKAKLNKMYKTSWGWAVPSSGQLKLATHLRLLWLPTILTEKIKPLWKCWGDNLKRNLIQQAGWSWIITLTKLDNNWHKLIVIFVKHFLWRSTSKVLSMKKFYWSNDCDVVIVKQFWCMSSSKVIIVVLVSTTSKVMLVKWF